MKKQKNLIYGILCIILLFTLVACLEPMEEAHPFAEGHKKGVQKKIIKEYNELLEEKNEEEILNFLDENIEKLDKTYASTMIVDLGQYLEEEGYPIYHTYILLNRYQKYVSLETKSYINLFFNEAIDPFKSVDQLEIDLEELINRAIACENHLIAFSKGESKDEIYELYVDYIKTSIYGLEDPYIFTKENTSILKDEVIEVYKRAIENHEDSKTSNILSQYIKVLGENDHNIDKENIKKFHEDLDSIINKEFN